MHKNNFNKIKLMKKRAFPAPYPLSLSFPPHLFLSSILFPLFSFAPHTECALSYLTYYLHIINKN